MARYLLRAPAYVGGMYYPASPHQTLEVSLSDDMTPSRTWEPLDDAAKAAMGKLTNTTTTTSPATGATAPTGTQAPTPTGTQAQPKADTTKKRPNDRDAI